MSDNTDLTRRQLRILQEMKDGAILVNGDENTPQWWFEAGHTAHASSAKSLLKNGYVSVYRHSGGFPGIDYFELSPKAEIELSRGNIMNDNVIYLADRIETEPTYGSYEWIVRLHKHFDKPYLDHENDLIWFGVEGDPSEPEITNPR